jgi:hypothetical protein
MTGCTLAYSGSAQEPSKRSLNREKSKNPVAKPREGSRALGHTPYQKFGCVRYHLGVRSVRAQTKARALC